MVVSTCGWLLNSLSSSYKYVTGCHQLPVSFILARNYAARKGTREKARKKKVKVVIEKVGFIPYNMRDLKSKNVKKTFEISDDSNKPDPVDNVWHNEHYKSKIYSFEEAVQAHRETHHPTMYNLPNAYIKAFIELDMQGTKKTRFVSAFTRVVCMPNEFNHGQNRQIMAFCKSSEMQEVARLAGAHKFGGKELIKQIQSGSVLLNDYDIIISEPTILPDLLLIRGLMKKKFPSTKLGTLDSDVKLLVTKFLNGVKYTAKPNELLNTYGTTEVIFGTLDMDVKKLEENFAAVINDINKAKPRRPEPFIRRIQLTSPPSSEMLKVEFEHHLLKNSVEQETEEDEQDAVIASH